MTKFGRRSDILSKFLCTASMGCLISGAEAIVVQLEYGYDTGNFFSSGSAARARLEEAAGFFENLLEDDLEAITPAGSYEFFEDDSWEVNFTNPSTGGTATIDGLVVPADTVIIFVGSRSLSGGSIAEAGFGGASYFAFPAFEETITTRGESGVGTTDFAPWGGFLSVSTGTTWDTSVAGNGTHQHLYSTLLHEISHVLGIGTADSWDAQINGSNHFTGSASVAEYGGNVPLHFSAGSGRYDHWQAGLTSDIYGTSTSQETALDPNILAGTVKLFTNLDVAALDDIGWDIASIPEPSLISLFCAGGLLLLHRRRR